MLSPEASAEPGRWDTSRAEYQRGIMDAVADPATETVVVMTSSQVGKTELLNNIVGFHIDQDPAPMLMVLPTLELGEAWSKDRLAPMLRDTPCLKGRVKDVRSRDSGNTLLHKTFPGGHITIAGANSAASLASRPIRVVLADEVDRYPASAGTEGDPVSLAMKRSTTFWNKKAILTSTPTVAGVSRIEAAFLGSDQRRFFVPCPDCGERQVLAWANVRWPEGRPEAAGYVCPHCGSVWDDARRWAAVARGEWRATVAFAGTAGFHLWEAYSPWVRLGDMARAFLRAKRHPELLRTWVNTSLGEVWRDDDGAIQVEGLAGRAEAWSELPRGVVALTAGIDIQPDRAELSLIGWGGGEEAWVIEHRVVWGDPTAGQLWADLDHLLARRFVHSLDMADLPIRAACIDTGGSATLSVYAWLHGKAAKRIWGVKGRSTPGGPLWPKRPSRASKGRIPLFLLNVDAGKETLYARLRATTPGPGFVHVHRDLPDTYFSGLTAERVTTRYVKGHPRREWVLPSGARNEPLDCYVYALAALHGLKSMGFELDHEAVHQAGNVRPRSGASVPTGRLSGAAEAAGAERREDQSVAPRSASARPRVVRSAWLGG